jgi:hypothetical protein
LSNQADARRRAQDRLRNAKGHLSTIQRNPTASASDIQAARDEIDAAQLEVTETQAAEDAANRGQARGFPWG